MIKINRGAFPTHLKVFKDKCVRAGNGSKVTKAEQELEKAIEFFTNSAHYANDKKLTKKNFKFAIYKDPELASHLESVFGSKCAYCESHFAHVTPKEIEHFRPKSKIDSGSGALRPGYYWLAGNWDNLLVSCVDCNRSRRHSVPGQAAQMTLGKKSQFPLADETKRVRKPAALDSEENERLLLNPCADQCEDYLTYNEKGLIFPAQTPQAQPSLKGATSITVYALQRKALVEERLQVLMRLRFNFEQLSYLAKIQNNLNALGASKALIEENSQQIRAIANVLRDMLASDAPYLGMLREWIRVNKGLGQFDNLLQFGIEPMKLL